MARHRRRHGFDEQNTALDAAAHGYWLHHAMDEIEEIYGHYSSTEARRLSSRKFGRTTNADSGIKTTVMNLQGTEVHETFVTTNLIDSIISTDAGDDQVIVIEGCQYSGSDLLPVSQEVTLNGQTEVTLATPLGRVDRAYVKAGTFAVPSTDLVGTVSIYDNTGVTPAAGVPDVAAAVKAVILPGVNQTNKAALSVSSTDYLIIVGMDASITRGAAIGNADIEIEWREQGGVWRPSGAELALRVDATNASFIHLTPYIIIPPNSDVRIVVVTTSDNTTVRAHIDALLAQVTGTVPG